MTTLAIIGTAGGVGASTLAALTFAGLRHRPGGAPSVHGDGPHGIAERIGDSEVPLVDAGSSIWDSGLTGPRAVISVLERPGAIVVLVAPDTPIGRADTAACVEGAVERFGPEVVSRISLVHMDVYRSGSRRRTAPPPANIAVVRIPHDRALAEPGPIPAQEALHQHTRAGVSAWLDLANRALPQGQGASAPR